MSVSCEPSTRAMVPDLTANPASPSVISQAKADPEPRREAPRGARPNAVAVPIVLVIDPDPAARRRMRQALEPSGCRVVEAEQLDSAASTNAAGVDVVVLNVSAAEQSPDQGIESTTDDEPADCLRRIRARYPEARVITIVGNSDQEREIAALRAGASHCLMAPIHHEKLVILVRRAIFSLRLARDNRSLRGALSMPSVPVQPVARSTVMRQVLQRLMSVGERPAPLLIAGPQGSGKTTLAQWVHQRGERALRPLIPFDCRTAEGDAFELMFFGRAPRVQGGTERPGILEIAHGATLLLENVDCLPAAFQPAVAEFLESGQVRRLGSHTMLRPDVRIIATATTPTDVARGAARPSDIDLDAWHDSTGSDTDGRTGLLDNVDDDLRGRLSDLTVCLPPLRARQVDIPELAERIYQRLTRRAPRLPVRLSPRAIGVLKQADWPGNVRQMADVLFRAAIATGDATVGAAAVESALRATARAYGPTCIEESGDYSDASASLAGRTLAEIERRSIVETIRSTGGNKAKAARLLGVSEKTIYNKIRHYGLRAELPS